MLHVNYVAPLTCLNAFKDDTVCIWASIPVPTVQYLCSIFQEYIGRKKYNITNDITSGYEISWIFTTVQNVELLSLFWKEKIELLFPIFYLKNVKKHYFLIIFELLSINGFCNYLIL